MFFGLGVALAMPQVLRPHLVAMVGVEAVRAQRIKQAMRTLAAVVLDTLDRKPLVALEALESSS